MRKTWKYWKYLFVVCLELFPSVNNNYSNRFHASSCIHLISRSAPSTMLSICIMAAALLVQNWQRRSNLTPFSNVSRHVLALSLLPQNLYRVSCRKLYGVYPDPQHFRHTDCSCNVGSVQAFSFHQCGDSALRYSSQTTAIKEDLGTVTIVSFPFSLLMAFIVPLDRTDACLFTTCEVSLVLSFLHLRCSP